MGHVLLLTDSDLDEAQRIAARTPPSKPHRPLANLNMTRNEIAAIRGFSVQATEQAEKRSLRKCRVWYRRHGYALKRFLR